MYCYNVISTVIKIQVIFLINEPSCCSNNMNVQYLGNPIIVIVTPSRSLIVFRILGKFYKRKATSRYSKIPRLYLFSRKKNEL